MEKNIQLRWADPFHSEVSIQMDSYQFNSIHVLSDAKCFHKKRTHKWIKCLFKPDFDKYIRMFIDSLMFKDLTGFGFELDEVWDCDKFIYLMRDEFVLFLHFVKWNHYKKNLLLRYCSALISKSIRNDNKDGLSLEWKHQKLLHTFNENGNPDAKHFTHFPNEIWNN